MIQIAYDTNDNVIASGETIFPTENYTIINNINEVQYDGTPNFKTSDDTTINSSTEWLNYLSKYVE